MTTLTLADDLAERLTMLAAAQNKTLDELATDTLKHLVEPIPPSAPEPPQTLADELEGLVGIVDSRVMTSSPPGVSDRYEAAFAEIMDAKYPLRKASGEEK